MPLTDEYVFILILIPRKKRFVYRKSSKRAFCFCCPLPVLIMQYMEVGVRVIMAKTSIGTEGEISHFILVLVVVWHMVCEQARLRI